MQYIPSVQTTFLPKSNQLDFLVRGGAGVEFSDPTGASTDVTIATVGVVTIQCTIQSEGNIKKVDIQFFGVATKEELETLVKL